MLSGSIDLITKTLEELEELSLEDKIQALINTRDWNSIGLGEHSLAELMNGVLVNLAYNVTRNSLTSEGNRAIFN